MRTKLTALGALLVFLGGVFEVEAMDFSVEDQMRSIQAEVKNIENKEMDSKLTPEYMKDIQSKNKRYKPMSQEQEEKLKAWNRHDLKTTEKVLRDISAQKKFSGVPGVRSSFKQGAASGNNVLFGNSFKEFYKDQDTLRKGVLESNKIKLQAAAQKGKIRSINVLPVVSKELKEVNESWGIILNSIDGICFTGERGRHYIVIDVTRSDSWDAFNTFCDNVINPQKNPEQAEECFQAIKKIVANILPKTVERTAGRPNHKKMVVGEFINRIIKNTIVMTLH